MLVQSKEIGPAPCNSPNLVLDFHICLKDPLDRSIKTRYGNKKNLFRTELQRKITLEIAEQWDSLIPSLKWQWQISRYTMIISFILLFAVPFCLWYFGDFSESQSVIYACISASVILVIAILSTCFWIKGATNKFRKKFVKKLLRNYVRELATRYEFNFTILYPVIFYFQCNNNSNLEKQIYCVVRISDGVVYCDGNTEPIYFTTSDLMREIHSKYSNDRYQRDLEPAVSYTPKSDTNPPILHQMRKDNQQKYSLLSPLAHHSPLINKFNFNKLDQKHQNIQNMKAQSASNVYTHFRRY